MNPVNAGDALALVKGVMPAATSHPELVEVAIFPPYPWLLGIAEVIEGTTVKLGAQDCFWEMSGAFTGEVSPAMLKGWCQWVITGHSERRAYLRETDDMAARKTAAALANDLSAIMRVGELDEHYGAGQTGERGAAQVRSGLARRHAGAPAPLATADQPG